MTYKLKIIQDHDCKDPREWDNLGTLVCWHKRHSLGDEHGYDRDTFWPTIADEHAPDAIDLARKTLGIDDEDDLPDSVHENIAREALVILPVYLYDHSGITISHRPFSCFWDSGQVGWIFCPKGKEGLTDDHIRLNLISEIADYNQYLTGDVWGFILEDEDGEEIESCWGFYGNDPATNGIADHIGSEALATCEITYHYN